MAALLLAFLALRSPQENWLLEYHAGSTLEGPATRAWIRRASFHTPGGALLSGLPDREDFSIRLQSCVVLRAARDLLFRLNADDHARLWVDGELILATEDQGSGGPQKKTTKQLKLGSGTHPIAIEYVNVHGAAELHLDVKQKGVHDFRSLQGLTRRPDLSGQCGAD